MVRVVQVLQIYLPEYLPIDRGLNTTQGSDTVIDLHPIKLSIPKFFTITTFIILKQQESMTSNFCLINYIKITIYKMFIYKQYFMH